MSSKSLNFFVFVPRRHMQYTSNRKERHRWTFSMDKTQPLVELSRRRFKLEERVKPKMIRGRYNLYSTLKF